MVQWGGADVWKIGGKVFAIAGWSNGLQLAVTFKCSRMSFDLLSTAPGMRPAPYLASRGMIWLQSTTRETLDQASLQDYVRESYRLVGLGLTKALRKELGLG